MKITLGYESKFLFVYFQSGPFILKSPPVSTFHQQLWLMAFISTDFDLGTTFTYGYKTQNIKGLVAVLCIFNNWLWYELHH